MDSFTNSTKPSKPAGHGEDHSQSSGSDKQATIHKWIHRVTEKGIGQEEMLYAYEQWVSSSDYDTDLGFVGYMGPDLAVKQCIESFPMARRSEIRILDVGAGTGLVGKGLREQGFCHIDALDPSKAMLDVAKKLNIYENYIYEFITEKELPIESGTYDGITAVGCFCEGHMRCESLHELIRIVKPGGIILIITRYEWLETVLEYKGRLEPLMDKLEQEGKWQKLARIIAPAPHYTKEKDGIVWKYEVL